jgi:hypothetical protein
MTSPAPDELRVLILAPRGRDASVMATVLARSGVGAVECTDAASWLAAIEASAGVAIARQGAATPPPRP